jgi:Surface-adhesin protein E
MLRTVITAAALALAATAQADAPQWTLVTETGASVAYIDRSSVTEFSGKKTIWVLRNYAESINLGLDPVTDAPWYPNRSVKVMYSVDCSAGQVALTAWQMYSGNFADGGVVWADKHYGLPAYSAPAAAEESAAVVAACGAKTALR